MQIKVGVLKDILESALSELEDWDINDVVNTHANTYGLGDEFIALGYNGYVPLGNFDIDYASNAEESKKHESAKKKLQAKVDEAKARVKEELSPKLQDRTKFKALDKFISKLPCLGEDTIGLTTDQIRTEGIGYSVGSEEENKEAAKDIFGDFDDYFTWSVERETADDGDAYFILAKPKAVLWTLSLGELKQVFELLDDAFKPYC